LLGLSGSAIAGIAIGSALLALLAIGGLAVILCAK